LYIVSANKALRQQGDRMLGIVCHLLRASSILVQCRKNC